jgi:hypothetical protein
MGNKNRICFSGLALLLFSAWMPVSHADAGLDARLEKLYADVGSHFHPSSEPGLPAPGMMAKDLFLIALKSYCGLLESPDAKYITDPGRFSMVDYNQDSKTPRLFVYDVRNRRMIRNTWVSHATQSSLAIYFRIGNTDFSQLNTLNEEILSFRAGPPVFFGDIPNTPVSPVGMTVAEPTSYESKRRYWGGLQGTSVRLIGVDGALNANLHKRGVDLHGFNFHINDFSKVGAPESLSCVMIDSSIAIDVMNEMMGGPVMLYHDRLFPEINEQIHQAQLRELSQMGEQIVRRLRALGAKYGWSEAGIARNAAALKARLEPVRAETERTYRYFKNGSRYITFEPQDPRRCEQVLGI